jgi:multiple sugar transport system substrate-binding protein
MRTRRTLTILAALLLAVAACGDGDDTGGEADGGEAIEMVWTLPATWSEFQTVADMWNDENPDRQVTIELLPEGADEQRQQLSLELNAGESNFDVLGLDVIWTGEFAENGWLEPIDDLAGEVDDVLAAGPLESARWQGELWAVPQISGAGVLYYRTDLVDEPPTTWPEMMEIALEVGEEEGIFPYVAQGAQYEGFVVNYLEYMWSAGGDLFDSDQQEVLFGQDDAAREALEFMIEGMERGMYAPGFNQMQEEEARTEFQRGNAVFMRNWPYAHPLMSEPGESDVHDTFDVAPLPTFTGEGTISAVGGVNNAISAFSEHKDEAREFIVWLATDLDVQREMTNQAQVPVLESIFDELDDDPVFSVLGEVLPHARARPPVPEWNEISVAMQQELFPAYNGNADPEQAIANVRSALEATLE